MNSTCYLKRIIEDNWREYIRPLVKEAIVKPVKRFSPLKGNVQMKRFNKSTTQR